jgi:hypothetical protein
LLFSWNLNSYDSPCQNAAVPKGFYPTGTPELRMSAQRNTAKRKRKREKWGTSKKSLNTPPSKQALVVGLYLTGRKRSAISRELGLDRETVTRILSQEENQILLQGYRQALLRIVPRALIGASELVDRLDRQMITDVLRGARVFIDRHEVENIPPPVRDHSYPRILFFGKYKRWPTDEEAIKFEKTIVVKPTVKGALRE